MAKSVKGSPVPLEDVWILEEGYWNDAGVWMDEDVWKDFPILDIRVKPNIQLFRNDDFSNRMYDVEQIVNTFQQTQYWEMKDTFLTSKVFGAFIWDNKILDIAVYFSRRYWVDNFPAIVEALKYAGTYRAIETIVESAMGGGSITFSNPEPSHLIIQIAAETQLFDWGALTPPDVMDVIEAVEPDGNDTIQFAHSTAALTLQETIKLIELLNVNGVFLEIQTV